MSGAEEFVSLKLFYNFGRLPLIIYPRYFDTAKGFMVVSGRAMFVKAEHDRSKIKTSKGVYVCRWCGNEMSRRAQLFCSSVCEWEFNWRVGRFASWQQFRHMVFVRDGKQCKMCGKNLVLSDRFGNSFTFDFVCDHIVPLCRGGLDWVNDVEMSNFQTLCVDCNKAKTRMDLSKPKPVEIKVRSDMLLTSFLEAKLC